MGTLSQYLIHIGILLRLGQECILQMTTGAKHAPMAIANDVCCGVTLRPRSRFCNRRHLLVRRFPCTGRGHFWTLAPDLCAIVTQHAQIHHMVVLSHNASSLHHHINCTVNVCDSKHETACTDCLQLKQSKIRAGHSAMSMHPADTHYDVPQKGVCQTPRFSALSKACCL